MHHPAQQRAARKALNASYGDSRFDQQAVQCELGFEKNGSTIVDALFVHPFEYFYPSAIGSALFYEGAFERGEIALTNRVLSLSSAPVVLDIGANIGVHTCAWAHAHPNARVFAFEPTDATRAMLRRNVDRAALTERVTIRAEGVGAAPGAATLYVCEDGAYNSLRQFGERPGTATTEIILTTIDHFVREHALSTLNLIKIDVEGFESEVIAGAAQTLRDLRPALLVEIGRSQGESAAEETIAKIVDFGYTLFTVVDGFALPFERYNGAFENHLFVDARVPADLPRYPGDDFMLERTAHRIDLIARLEQEVATIHELKKANASLQAACDERAQLLESQARELAENSRVISEIEADAANSS